MNKVVSSMLFQEDGDWIGGAMIWCAILIVLLLTLTFLVWSPEWRAQNDKDKALIDSLTCKDLGKWLIDNSMTRTDSKDYVDTMYHYAQAKYLVCTHGGT